MGLATSTRLSSDTAYPHVPGLLGTYPKFFFALPVRPSLRYRCKYEGEKKKWEFPSDCPVLNQGLVRPIPRWGIDELKVSPDLIIKERREHGQLAAASPHWDVLVRSNQHVGPPWVFL